MKVMKATEKRKTIMNRQPSVEHWGWNPWMETPGNMEGPGKSIFRPQVVVEGGPTKIRPWLDLAARTVPYLEHS